MDAVLQRDAEIALTDREMDRIVRLVYERSGIALHRGKRALVVARLHKVLKAGGFASFADYVHHVETDHTGHELSVLLDAITTNHTSFFRENHHFEHFAAEVRPVLLRRAAQGERVRLWSSASSTGEEPYSLAMTLLGTDRNEGARIAGSDTMILATDLSPTVIAKAKAATYPLTTTAAVPRPLASTWLRNQNGLSVIDPLCAGLVRYRELNLMQDWPFQGKFDVIFCRNVMIYFDDPTKERLQRRLVERLLPGGYFYIGHSERLIGYAAEQCRPIGHTIYRKDQA